MREGRHGGSRDSELDRGGWVRGREGGREGERERERAREGARERGSERENSVGEATVPPNPPRTRCLLRHHSGMAITLA